MKEGITARVGRIISASVNALVDAVENAAPEVIMEEAIREVDGVIDEVRRELGKSIAAKHLAGQRLEDGRTRHKELSEKAHFAVGEGRDDLAEAAIAQQLDIEAQTPILEKALSESESRQKELEGYITALQAKRREMRDERSRFIASRQKTPTSTGSGPAGDGSGLAGKVAHAGSAFERILEKNTGLPATPGTGDNAAKLAELEDLARKNRILERLAAIKVSEK